MLCLGCMKCMLEVTDYTGADVWVCVDCDRVEELKPRPRPAITPIPPRLVLGHAAPPVRFRGGGGPSAA